jgi:hypothetical protein
MHLNAYLIMNASSSLGYLNVFIKIYVLQVLGVPHVLLHLLHLLLL